MKKVRSGVFETNSSSTHSLVLSSDFTNMIEAPLPESMSDNGVYHIFSGEYGWEIDEYYDVSTKASYLYVDAMRYADLSVDPNDPDYREENGKLKILADAFKVYAGVDVVFERDTASSYYPFGHIDHQSHGICNEVWDDGVSGVVRFVFSNDSSFQTDNDNH